MCFKVLNNRIIFKCRPAFTMTGSMTSSGLWKMLYLTMFILTMSGVIGCVINGTWCQMVWYQLDDAVPHAYPMLWNVDSMCQSPCAPLPSLWCGPYVVCPWWFRSVYLSQGSLVMNKTSSHMWDNCYFPMFLLCDGSLTFIYITSLMVIVRLFESLPIMENCTT